MKFDLLNRAISGLKGKGRLKRVTLRRAVSDAYYALFHALCELCADQMIGSTSRASEAWRKVYRALEHGHMKATFQNKDILLLSPHVEAIGKIFIILQEERHRADYDPHFPYTRKAEVEVFINQAKIAFVVLALISPETARTLSTHLLFKKR